MEKGTYEVTVGVSHSDGKVSYSHDEIVHNCYSAEQAVEKVNERLDSNLYAAWAKRIK